jgi:hypothetical protein
MQRARYTTLDKPKSAREVGKIRSLTVVGSALPSIPSNSELLYIKRRGKGLPNGLMLTVYCYD